MNIPRAGLHPHRLYYFRNGNNAHKKAGEFLIRAAGMLYLSMLVFSCAPATADRHYLDGPWYWAPGSAAETPAATFAHTFTELPADRLRDLTALLPSGEGFLWLKTGFRLDPGTTTGQYGLYLGRITMADSTWIDGVLVGEEGSPPPRLWSAWNVFRNYPLPGNLLAGRSEHTLLLKVYVGHEGSLADRGFVAPLPDTSAAQWLQVFTNSTINAGAAVLMLVFGLYHLILFARRPKEKECLSFALLSLLGAVYLGNFFAGYIPQIRHNPPNFLLFQKLVAGMTIYPIAFLFASFVRDFLGLKERRLFWWLRLAACLVPVLITLVMPDYRTLRMIRGPLTLLFLLPMAAYSLWLVVAALRKQRRETLALLLGVSPLFLTALLDILLHNLLQLSDLPYFMGFGFPLMILSLLFILAGRFAAARTEAENLNTNLEGLVTERTAELSRTNASLSETMGELEQARLLAEKDMKMAVQVQGSFYPKHPPRSTRWDCAFEFRPAAGVSGDVFDFYQNGAELYGLGLFDISGHGMAAGLIGMITKSIAANCFEEGKAVSLSKVMTEIGRRLVKEKGEVENHATGLLLRFGEGMVEYTNAGHTELLQRSADGQVHVVNLSDGRDFRGNILGIEDMQSNYTVLKFRIRPGDVLLACTDGLTEARNRAGEEFGQDRLAKALAGAQGQNAAAILAWILEEVADFCDGEAFRDDLTAIVLKQR